jgi:hypothetical protein
MVYMDEFFLGGDEMDVKSKKETLLFGSVAVFLIVVFVIFYYALMKGVVMVPFG